MQLQEVSATTWSAQKQSLHLECAPNHLWGILWGIDLRGEAHVLPNYGRLIVYVYRKSAQLGTGRKGLLRTLGIHVPLISSSSDAVLIYY